VSIIEGAVKKLDAHIWEREANEHYVEPRWCSERLFTDEAFVGEVYDPCCGFGRIIEGARKLGLTAYGSDLIDRGFAGAKSGIDFLSTDIDNVDNIVCNPPFDIASAFAAKALATARGRVAMIFPTARLNAAHWLHGTPLRRVWMMTPRPSMPPGHVITAGGKITGGKMDYCWLVWEVGHKGEAEIKWLRRDAAPSRS
jgi:hypothetical protein